MEPQIADYQLIERLGEGSTGVLYRASPPSRLDVDGPVALKVLSKHSSDDDFRRFANEIRLFAAVKSPFLVPVLDAGHQNGTLYYAMQYFPQGSLGKAASEGSTDTAGLIDAVYCAALGAHELHEVGVAHRDIKPSNILLSRDGAVLADLGLAQVLTPGTIITGTGPIGSIEFMPPSIVRGEKASRATDIWELGASLHKALTGVSVYGEIPTASVLSALRYVLETTPQINEEIPESIRHCLDRALAGDPELRYPTAAVFASDLKEAT